MSNDIQKSTINTAYLAALRKLLFNKISPELLPQSLSTDAKKEEFIRKVQILTQRESVDEFLRSNTLTRARGKSISDLAEEKKDEDVITISRLDCYFRLKAIRCEQPTERVADDKKEELLKQRDEWQDLESMLQKIIRVFSLNSGATNTIKITSEKVVEEHKEKSSCQI